MPEKSVFPDDWRGALQTALRAARRGREILLEHFGHLEHVEKKYQAGLVSEADRLSEQAITEILLAAYPDSEILGEEADAEGRTKVQPGRAGAQGRWIIDPLDGTTNYIHRFPVFCISIGLEVAGQLQVGVIDVPMLGETYTAIRGGGAYVNGRRLRVSETALIEDSLLATGFFAEDKAALEEQLHKFSRVVGDARGVRRAGAAAYDLCQVAAGVFDGFWEKNLKPWDVAAGQLLVEEAGGTVIDYAGKEHHPYSGSLISGNSAIVSEISRRFKASSSSRPG